MVVVCWSSASGLFAQPFSGSGSAANGSRQGKAVKPVQIGGVSAQPFIKSWTTVDGLPQDNVVNVAQTRDGYLWVATVDGLARFDGVRFKVFNKSNTPELPSNRIFGMFGDKDGRLWITYPGDEMVVVYEDRTFRQFVRGRDYQKDGPVGQASIQYFADRYRHLQRAAEMTFRSGDDIYFYRNGKFEKRPVASEPFPSRVFVSDTPGVWIDGGDDIFHILGGKAIRYPAAGPLPFDRSRVYAVDSEEKDGVIWFFSDLTQNSLPARSKNKLCSFADGKLTVHPEITDVSDLEIDGKGNLWMTRYDGALLKVAAETLAGNTSVTLSYLSLPSWGGWMLYRDQAGTVWFGGGNGLRMITTDQAVTVFSKATGLPNENSYAIVQDRENTIWFGAWPDSLISYRDGIFSSEYSLFLTALFVDSRSRLWKRQTGGISYLEDKKWKALGLKASMSPEAASRLFSGEVLVGEVAFIAEDRDGSMLFGTESGLIRYSGTDSAISTADDGLPSNVLTSYLITRSGDLWIGTDRGVAKRENGRFTAFTENDGLAGNYTRSFYEDADGTIWIGAYDGGLTRFKNGSFSKITKSNGLFSDGVFVILEDDNGWFWINSNQGIFRVRRQELNDFADGNAPSVTSVSYGPEDGLRDTEGNGGKQPAGLKAADGKFWFPMAKGVAVIDPRVSAQRTSPPPVLIEEARIDQKVADISNGTIRVEPGQIALEVDYTALGFVGAERMRFKYRIEGLDDSWIEAGMRRTAYFSHLPYGEYTLHVAAASYDGVWNNEGAMIKLVVVPPFYRQMWFYALVILGLSSFLTAIYLTRVRRLSEISEARSGFARRLIESQEGERRRIALELHDSIGQTLAVIRNRTLLGLGTDDPGKTREQLSEISEISNLALKETRAIAHNLHPAQIENLGLTTALTSLVSSVGGATGMQCRADIDELPPELPYEAAISIYRISQECLSNIIKHSDASFASVSLKLTGDDVVLTIEDDGRGFTPNQNPGGLGLTGIRERANIIGADLRIDSRPGHGTRTILIFKLTR